MKRKREFSIIEMFKNKFSPSSKRIGLGIGDDAAVIDNFPGKSVFSTDILVEDVHFDKSFHPPQLLGKKAISVNVSDINAMGGIPEFALLAMAIPPSLKDGYIEKVGQGIAEGCRQYGLEIVGGDISRSPGPFFINIMIWGKVEKAVSRSGARPGDDIWVTGTIGDSHAGWLWLSGEANEKELKKVRANGWKGLKKRNLLYLVNRHLDPLVYNQAGPALAGLVNSMIDISDGLSNDLGHICSQSGVGALIELDKLPLSWSLREWAKQKQKDPFKIALRGGEDYQLLFSGPPEKENEIRETMRLKGVKITKIGKIQEKDWGIKIFHKKRLRPLKEEGWDHFVG